MTQRHRGWSLSAKVTLAYSILISLAAGALTTSLYIQAKVTQRQAIRERLQDIVGLAAPQIDSDYHSLLVRPEDTSSPYYSILLKQLENIQTNSQAIQRIYTLRTIADGTIVIVLDYATNGQVMAAIGEPLKTINPLLKNGLTEITEPIVAETISRSPNGEPVIYGYAPIMDPMGRQEGVLVVELDASPVIASEARARNIALVNILIALPVALIVGRVLTQRLIVYPILGLKNAAQHLANGEWEQTLPTNRTDELGELATSFNRMASQLKESFASLEAKNTELQALDKLKDEFLANTSHELRTPLNGIIGLAESLMDGVGGELPAPGINNLAMIVSAGRRLSNLINDILDFSKLQHQNIELQLRPVEIKTIVEIVIALSQPLINKKSIQLINGIETEIPLVNADENRLQQILLNLVGNAIKFTETGMVIVKAEVVDQEVALTVADTGIGIPTDKLERIFISFEQLEGASDRQYGGTGLGLAVTKQLVELHQGTIRVTSQVGVGSEFTFTLPICENQNLETVPQSSIQPLKLNPNLATISDISTPVSYSQNGNVKILVVDDEPINLQVLVNHLCLQNYAITQATNGAEALEIIENGFKPDLVLLDVMMPKMTGYEVTRKLRETWPASELPILLLTAKNQVSDIVTGLESGANDYLTKPIAKDELLARIQTHLNLIHLRAENMRLGAELEITRQLQQMILPRPEELLQIPGLEIAGFMEPADEVGGDYYDILNDQGRIKIGIGDVTGHGLESGVLMMMVQMAVRTLLTTNHCNPKEFISLLNHATYQNTQRMNSDKTMTLALLDYHEGHLKITGQHEELIIVRATGKIERLDTLDLGFPIALEADISNFVSEAEIQLNQGDGIVLYTDGITEAENLAGEQYGLERLCQVISTNWQQSVEEVKEAVIQDVKNHIGEQKVYDDITLVILKQKE